MPARDREFELKLAVRQEALDRLRKCETLHVCGVGHPDSKLLISTYFDTSDHRLWAEGMTLRVRETNDHWRQTLKSEITMRPGLSNPVELEAELDAPTPCLKAIKNKNFRRKLRRLMKGAELQPIFQTEISRTSQDVALPDGSRIELALDNGRIRGLDREVAISEAEIELKLGNPGAVALVAEDLFVNAQPQLATSSKAARGFDLISGADMEPMSPVRAEVLKFDADEPARGAVIRMIGSAAAQVLKNWVVVLEHDRPEAVHQMRIGLRRLRMALAFSQSIKKFGIAQELRGDARDLGRVLSTLRDADVLSSDIVNKALAGRENGTSDRRLLDLLEGERTKCRADVLRALRSARWTRFMVRLAVLPEALDQELSTLRGRTAKVPLHRLAKKCLARLWRRVKRSGQRIGSLNTEERHRMRKDLKALRYAADFLDSIYPPKKVKKFRRQLRRLQDTFGYLNDVSLANRLTNVANEHFREDAEGHRLVGFVIGWHTAHADDVWKDAQVKWKEISQSPVFWD